MKLSILAGSTSQTINVFIRDSSSTTGAGLTGLAYNTASLTAYYILPRAAAVAITLATQTVTGAWSSGGFVEISSANAPGWYRLDLPDAAIASGRFSSLHLKGATNMAPLPIEIELTAWNNQDAVHGGMSALPNTACTTNASLLTSGTGTDQVSVTSGQVDLGKILGTTSAGAVGYVGVDWAHVNAPTTTVNLSGTTIAVTQKVDVDTIKTNPVVNGGTITFPTGATLASTTNITAGTITTATNLTNLPAITADWLTGTGVAASAVTKIQAGLSTYGGGDTSGTTTLLARLTSTRSGYLDNLSGGAVALASGVIVTTNSDKTGYSLTVSPPTAAAIATAVLTSLCTEPTSVVGASPTVIAALSWILTLSRNKITQTSTSQILKADNGTTTIATSPVSDDGTTFTRGEFA